MGISNSAVAGHLTFPYPKFALNYNVCKMKRPAENGGISGSSSQPQKRVRFDDVNVSAAIGTQEAPTSGVDEPTEEVIEKKGLEYGGGDIGEGKFTPFNLDEVRQLGNIGKDGEFTWTRRTVGGESTKGEEDAWLKDTKVISSEVLTKIKEREKQMQTQSEKKAFNKIESLKIVAKFLKNFETVNEALKRLGKQSNGTKRKKKSWREKRKKVETNSASGNKKESVTNNSDFLTLSTATTDLLMEGGMNDIYQYSKERILVLLKRV